MKALEGGLGDHEIVQIAAIVAIQSYVKTLLKPALLASGQITRIISAINDFVAAQDPEDLADSEDLLMAVVETIRCVVMLDPAIVLTPDVPALDILFTLISRAASSLQLTSLVNETFNDIAVQIALNVQQYVKLCERVLPSLTSALWFADDSQINHLAIVSSFASEV